MKILLESEVRMAAPGVNPGMCVHWFRFMLAIQADSLNCTVQARA
jgi:hypothetical protein